MQLLSLLLLIPSGDKWLIDILPPPLITVARIRVGVVDVCVVVYAIINIYAAAFYTDVLTKIIFFQKLFEGDYSSCFLNIFRYTVPNYWS